MLAHVDGPALTRLDELEWIGSIARTGAERCPERDAIIFPDRGIKLTYRDLDRRSDAFYDFLKVHGLGLGDRIAYLGRNSDLFLPVLFGAIRAGVVLVPINWRLAAPEVAYQLQDSGSRLLLCDPELMALAVAATERLTERLQILPTEVTEGAKKSATEVAAESTAVGTGESLRSRLSQRALPAPLPTAKDQVVLHLYTSGTTGHPKGVLISHYALSIARHCELTSADFALLTPASVSLSAMPNFHVGGLSWVLMGLVRLGTVVLTANPSPTNMLALLNEYRVESSFIVPTVIRGIVDEINSRRVPAPPITGMFYGAMTMGAGLLSETMDVFGCSFGQFFGMTEITGAATFLGPRDHDLARPHLLKSVGKPYPGMSIEIRGPDRRVLKVGEHGEIWIRSPTRMLGYHRLPDATREALVNGWYATGDGGYLDADGYLYLTDRIKDLIVSGGENVYPAEVEEMLRAHPAVLDAACVGIEHPVWGESVTAVIELRSGHVVTAEELRKFSRSRIATYKCPKQFHFAMSLPRTASGKVKRAELRAGLRESDTPTMDGPSA
jgi:acyl-CoA synthetase (AMP-forming)/AMP-acid ligase II